MIDESSSYVRGHYQIAESPTQPLGVVQRQIGILEHDGLIESLTTCGPSGPLYAMRVTAAGLKHLESPE